jgi:PAS domain S-box-containing protein
VGKLPPRVQGLLERDSVLHAGIVESLTDAVVLLDDNGTIIDMNEAWGSFEPSGGQFHPGQGKVGESYLALLREEADSGSEPAKLAADGVVSVLEGRRSEFTFSFDCTDFNGGRTFSLTAVPLVIERSGAIVAFREVLVSPEQRKLYPGIPSTRSFSAVGASIMPAIARNLARGLGVRHAYVCEVLEGQPRQLRIVAHWAGEGFKSNVIYAAAGTPCERVTDGLFCHIPSHLQETFPDDAWLGEIGAESYMGVPVHDTEGKIIGHVAVLHTKPLPGDASIEVALRLAAIDVAPELERRRYFTRAALEARLVETARDAIVGTDSAFIITSWNPAAEEIYGWRADEVIGRKVSEILQTDFTEQRRREALESVRSVGEVRGEYVQRRRDGSSVEIEAVTMAIIENEGEVSGYVSVNRDITERKLAERKLAEALSAKDQFLSLVSHELRTPLTMIMGNAWSIAHRSRPEDHAQVVENSEIVYEQAVKLTAIIDNLLSLSRVERGEAPPLVPVDLDKLLPQILARPEVPGQHEIELSVSSDRLIVLANPTAVEQILINLLANAAKYSPAGSSIFVTAKVEGAQAVISLRDQGKGIPEEAVPHVFQPYFRAGEVTKIPGMGIGLTVCRRLVEAMNGRIWAENHPEGGAVFSFSLQLAQDTERATPELLEVEALNASAEERVA